MAENRTLKGIYGEAGAAYVTGTAAVTGDFCAITSLSDSTYFSAITWGELNKSQVDGSTIGNTDNIVASGDTIPAGTTIYGQITGFTLGAGRVIAYNAA